MNAIKSNRDLDKIRRIAVFYDKSIIKKRHFFASIVFISVFLSINSIGNYFLLSVLSGLLASFILLKFGLSLIKSEEQEILEILSVYEPVDNDRYTDIKNKMLGGETALHVHELIRWVDYERELLVNRKA